MTSTERREPVPADEIGDGLARWAYARGESVIDHAESRVRIALNVHQTVVEGREANRASFPGYSQDLSHEALARRILGLLLDLGWTPPELSDPPTSRAQPEAQS